MKNDKKIWEKLNIMKTLIEQIIFYPNSCSYTDEIIEGIIEQSKELEELQNENMELLKKEVG